MIRSQLFWVLCINFPLVVEGYDLFGQDVAVDTIVCTEPGRLRKSSDNISTSSTSVQSSSQPMEEPSSLESSLKGFRDLGVLESLCEACDSLGYINPTPIQVQTIPLAIQGRDLIGLAETGSRKTAAFVLPILQALMDKPQSLHSYRCAYSRTCTANLSRCRSLGRWDLRPMYVVNWRS